MAIGGTFTQVVVTTAPLGIQGITGETGPTGAPGLASSRTILIENPGNNEDLTAWFQEDAFTITKLVPTYSGSTSPGEVAWFLVYGSDRDAAGTEVLAAEEVTDNANSQTPITIIANPNVPAQNFVWFETGATGVTGEVDEFSLTVIGV